MRRDFRQHGHVDAIVFQPLCQGEEIRIADSVGLAENTAAINMTPSGRPTDCRAAEAITNAHAATTAAIFNSDQMTAVVVMGM